MDENIKLQPEEEGKEFGYFPFEELPPVTTQVVEEVIECEIGNINIQHRSNRNKHRYPPPPEGRQTSQITGKRPTHETTKKTMGKQKSRPKHVHDGKQHLKVKTH